MTHYLNDQTGKPIAIDDNDVDSVEKTVDVYRTILVLKSGKEIPVRGTFEAICESVETGKHQ